MTILLTQDQQETIKAICSHIFVDGENWYHHPFWMRDCGNGRFEQVTYEQLPSNVKEYILTLRGIKL